MRRITALMVLLSAMVGLTAGTAFAQHDPTTTTTTTSTTSTTRHVPDNTTTTRRSTTTTTTEAPTTTTRPPSTTEPPTTTPSTIRASTSTTPESEESTTTTEAPPPAVVRSEPVQVVFTPGEPVQIVAESDVAFEPASVPTVTISSTGDDATTVEVEVIASVDADGNLVIDVVVPEDTPESIVVVTIRALDSRGVERTLVYLFPVAGPSTTTTTAGDALSRGGAARSSAEIAKEIERIMGGAPTPRWDQLPVVPVADVPVLVQQLQASVPDHETAQRLADAVTDGSGRYLDVKDGAIVASTPAATSGDIGPLPLLLAGGVVLLGGGLLVQRRRTIRSNGGAR